MEWSFQWHGGHRARIFLGWLGLGCVCVFSLFPPSARGQAPLTQAQGSAAEAVRLQSLMRQLESGHAATRVAAAKSLARLGPEAIGATDALIRQLRDRDSDVRLTAAYALGCIPAEPLPMLRALEPLLSDSDEHVRYSAQWSCARIAATIQTPTDAAQQQDLLGTLRQISQRMTEREYQPRHLAAIQATLTRLQPESLAGSEASLSVKQPVPLGQTAVAAEFQTLARSIYAASDLTSRYQIVDQVNQSPDPAALRKLIIACEKQQADGSILQYAISQWGAEGMACLAEEIMRWPANHRLAAEDARLLALFIPQQSADWQRLLDWALQSEQTIDGRVACLHALGQAPLDSATIERLTGALSRQNDDWEVRLAMVDTLASLGKRAAASEPELIRLLQTSNQTGLRSALARALIQVAPDSPSATDALHQVLHATALDDPFFGELVEHCRPLGARCQINLPEYTAGLQHPDVGVRLTCTQALGSLGSAASTAAPLLIERIVDRAESIVVKDAAAHALAHLGATGARQLIHELRRPDAAVREHVLRALAIVCPTDSELSQRCLKELTNPQSPMQVRVAAAGTLGSMGHAANAAVPELLKLCETGIDTSLRGACLLAAARIDPSATQPVLARYLEDKHLLMRATAAFACHLCGDSRMAYDGLVNLLDGSTTDQVIAGTLLDIGPAVEPWLLETACDTKADAEQRLICFRLATERARPNWYRLLPLLDDSDLGEQFAYCVEGNLQTETEVTACVLNLMRETQLSPITRARLARLLQPTSLGAGGEPSEDWSGLTLNQPQATGLLRAADQPMATAAAQPGFARDAAQAATAAKTAAPSTAGSAATRPEDRWPMAPAPASEVTGGDIGGDFGQVRNLAAVGNAEELGQPKVVEVFYGTNRGQAFIRAGLPSLTVGLLGTVAGALLTLSFCVLAFWRYGHRGLAAISFVAIGAVAGLGYQTAKQVQLADQTQQIAYGGQYQARVELGKCQVSIPPNHQIGMLESPNLFKLEIQQDPEKHLMLTKVEPLDRDVFYSSLHSTLDDKGKNILVFIHGYNVSFEDAARRTAQMAEDLKFPGAPVFYSWPSQANWYHYSTDRTNIEQSVPQIRQFLLDLAERSGADTINLIAHSMGNVGLTEALQTMESTSSRPLFHQLVLAAPDIDADVFKQQIAPSIVSKAAHVTLYTSQTDLALIASRYFNHGARVGDSASGVPLFPGIDTIDATAVDSSLLGHTYYGSNVSVLMDLGFLLRNQPISSRNYLRKIVNSPQPYWAFDNTRVSQSPGASSNR